MENSRDVVLFLGAGFSKLAGLPTMNTFGEESKNEIDRIDLGIKNQKRGIEKFQYFKKKGIIFTQFKDYCKNSEKFVKFDENNLEDIFCMAEIYKNYGPDEIRLKNENMIFKELYKDIQIWLWKIYQQLPASTSRNKENKINPKPYEKLIQIIKDLGIEKRLFILTTNYDIVFEYFAFKEKINCCYPFSKNDYHSINSSDNNKYISDYDNENSISSPVVCKLHGSINYFYNSCGEIFISDNTIEKYNRPIILRMNEANKIVVNDGLIPCIVPPTFSKLDINEWQKKTWNTALKALKNASKIIFIGYSFPPSDGFMKAFIQTAMADRNKEEPLEIFVIDPLTDTHNQYKLFFSPLITNLCRSSLKHFVKCFSEECLYRKKGTVG
jgi:NAD-dependent SIR2 family protein deacetylase